MFRKGGRRIGGALMKRRKRNKRKKRFVAIDTSNMVLIDNDTNMILILEAE